VVSTPGGERTRFSTVGRTLSGGLSGETKATHREEKEWA
jgi:hypothetical protein